MCGIFGICIHGQAKLTPQMLHLTINDLFKLSESRGKEAAGLAISGQDRIEVYKEAVSATAMLKSQAYKQWFDQVLHSFVVNAQGNSTPPVTVIGHSRLVTNGSMELHDNNQPVITNGLVGVHNGIIVNDGNLWQISPALQRHYEVDTEIILGLIRNFFNKTGSLVKATRQAFNLIKGTASIAVLFNDLNALLLATNNGSLYTCSNPKIGIHIFASERYMLQVLVKRAYMQKMLGEYEITQLIPGTGWIIDTADAKTEIFSLKGDTVQQHLKIMKSHPRIIQDTNLNGKHRVDAQPGAQLPTIIPESISNRFAIDVKKIAALRRCIKCLLPETMPLIEFDEHGVCNYCRNYKKIEILGHDTLLRTLESFCRKEQAPNCLVSLSGGRDSSYGLHYVKNELGLKPIAFTYDWGMVTDLARRNQARLCGQMGIEHILVSADIKTKRRNIRKNVSAWLKRPSLGTVPLFMAGDKQYFYYANKLRQQTGAGITVMCINPLERTDFKTGFCGVQPPSGSDPHHYALSLGDQARLATYYGREYLLNPLYLNGSILDTLGAFVSYYVIPHDYINLYNYIRWDEKVITSTLIQEYDWEVATDTHTTWRIGDGTAAFYNYIYYCVAGFTENDTFRSNQIREGMITRDQALQTIYDENQPRFDSIQWYCDTIGIDMENTLEHINAIPKLYM